MTDRNGVGNGTIGSDDLGAAAEFPDDPLHRPAIRYGWQAGARHGEEPFEVVAPRLQRDWDPATHGLTWGEARPLIRAAYRRAAGRIRRSNTSPMD